MGIDDSTLTPEGEDDPFFVGQKKEAFEYLGDPRKESDDTLDWDDSFLQDIHGVIIITVDSDETAKEKKKEVDKVFQSSSIKEIISIYGNRREGHLKDEQSVFICRLRCNITKLNLDSVSVS
jgi:hypothetical protein